MALRLRLAGVKAAVPGGVGMPWSEHQGSTGAPSKEHQVVTQLVSSAGDFFLGAVVICQLKEGLKWLPTVADGWLRLCC